MKNASFYILDKDKRYIPFEFYIKRWSGGDSESYHYLRHIYEREKLDNRWKVLYHCGKKFVANEGMENQIEVSPNDIVVVAHKIMWKRVLIMYIGTIILFNIANGFNHDYLKGMIGISGLFAFFCIMAFVSQLEYKKEAKEWNNQIIPAEKLL